MADRHGKIDKLSAAFEPMLVPTEDRGALARAVAHLVSHPDELAKLAERGRARAASLTWRTAAERTLAVYDEILATPASGPST